MYVACGKDMTYCSQKADSANYIFFKSDCHSVSHPTRPSYSMKLILLPLLVGSMSCPLGSAWVWDYSGSAVI